MKEHWAKSEGNALRDNVKMWCYLKIRVRRRYIITNPTEANEVQKLVM